MTDPQPDAVSAPSAGSADDNADSSSGYSGPPRMVPPPQGWKVPEVIVAAAPRRLPEQDHKAIDAEESRARTLTHGVGILAGSLMFVVLIVILVRAIT